VHPGEVVAERFQIEGEAGAGGMGRVYRASDRLDGGRVAVKVLTALDPMSEERFVREATVLATLRHPGIVQYVAHGATVGGERWLAMEWLEGETLSARMRRAPLTTAETLVMAGHAADALAAAHAHSIVHRDVKPSNLLLVDGAVERVKLVDFGVARRTREEDPVTTTGVLVGTWAYMAPEQALSDRELDARADLFSLGCVLYQCLTGVRAFRANDPTAVLAKILLEEPPRLAELRPDLPASLDDLVTRMLAKSPAARPASATEVAEALAEILEDLGEPVPAAPAPPPRALGPEERRLVVIILADALRDPDATQVLVAKNADPRERALDDAVAAAGGRIEWLADGSALAFFAGKGLPHDEASRAARCALAMRDALPRVPMAMATGLGVVTGRSLVGEVIDEGVAALRRARPGSIAVDGPTAELLTERFRVLSGELVGARAEVDVTRRLLGRPTPCVGRDREIGLLRSLFDECASEPVARVALLTGPAGAGKSRIRYELLRDLEASGAAVRVLVARGDPLGAGSPFALAAEAVRGAAGIGDSEPFGARRARLVELVRRVLPAGDERTQRTTELLGEMVRLPFPDEGREALRAARRDPTLMGQGMRAAWEDWLDAECSVQPVLLVLEDLHWGDLPTVRLVDGALRTLADRPFMVLALGRLELHTQFPNLWSERNPQEVRVGPLTRSASERLVRQALGPHVAAATIDRVVERSEGNAFYLEELIRAVAEGAEATLPRTLVGMVQARLDALGPSARRVLRAASVFGGRFWAGGARALLGSEGEAEEVGRELDRLTAIELVSPRPGATLPGETEWAFRHALVRETAYATLTDADRSLGHRLAGEWLERAGETDAKVLAEHFARGGVPDRAAELLARAARQALSGNDLAAAQSLAERALSSSPAGAHVGPTLLVQAEAHRWRGELDLAVECARQAATALPRGSTEWFLAVAELIGATTNLGRFEETTQALDEALDVVAAPGAAAARLICLARGGALVLERGHVATGDALLARGELLAAAVESDPFAIASWHWFKAMRALCGGDLGAFVASTRKALARFEEAGDLRSAVTQRTNLGYGVAELGDYAGAEVELRAALEQVQRMGLVSTAAYVLQNLASVLARLERPDEARRFAERAIDTSVAIANPRIEAASRLTLASLLRERGDLALAEAEVRRALLLLEGQPALRALGLATLGRVLAQGGRPDEARAAAADALAVLQAQGEIEDGETTVRLAWVEALRAAGDREAAQAAAREAAARLSVRAERITDRALRVSFLTRVPDNALTMALAAEANTPAA